MRLILLGSGDARQVPVYNCSCPACDAARVYPARRRGPCCALIECGAQRWLIDSGLTDLSERFAPHSLSGILQTHYHADQARTTRKGWPICTSTPASSTSANHSPLSSVASWVSCRSPRYH